MVVFWLILSMVGVALRALGEALLRTSERRLDA